MPSTSSLLKVLTFIKQYIWRKFHFNAILAIKLIIGDFKFYTKYILL